MGITTKYQQPIESQTLSNCNGSSAFYTREAVGPVTVIIWNKEHFVIF
jgi:hypothetical protein